MARNVNVSRYDYGEYFRGRKVVAAVFDDRADAERAITALRDAGFPADRIGVALRDRTEQGELVEETGTKGAEGPAGGAGRGAPRRAGGPAEERLEVEKRPAELGAVEVRKTVETEQQTVPVELTREEVHVEQRDVPTAPPPRPTWPGPSRRAPSASRCGARRRWPARRPWSPARW